MRACPPISDGGPKAPVLPEPVCPRVSTTRHGDIATKTSCAVAPAAFGSLRLKSLCAAIGQFLTGISSVAMSWPAAARARPEMTAIAAPDRKRTKSLERGQHMRVSCMIANSCHERLRRGTRAGSARRRPELKSRVLEPPACESVESLASRGYQKIQANSSPDCGPHYNDFLVTSIRCGCIRRLVFKGRDGCVGLFRRSVRIINCNVGQLSSSSQLAFIPQISLPATQNTGTPARSSRPCHRPACPAEADKHSPESIVAGRAQRPGADPGGESDSLRAPDPPPASN